MGEVNVLRCFDCDWGMNVPSDTVLEEVRKHFKESGECCIIGAVPYGENSEGILMCAYKLVGSDTILHECIKEKP